jgi:hypothetical protein
VGRKVDPIMFKVFHGKEHSLNDVLAQHKGVRASFGDRMPAGQTLCGRHPGTAAGVREERGRLIGFDSNRQDAITQIDAFARISGLRFPIPKDFGNKVADQHGATRTPLTFLSMRREPSATKGGSTINSRLAPAF